jgi:hypothetical protein
MFRSGAAVDLDDGERLTQKWFDNFVVGLCGCGAFLKIPQRYL